MKKFRFKYENILKMRLDVENDIKNKLKKLNNDLHLLEQNKIDVTHAYNNYKVDIEQSMKVGIKGYEIQNINHFQTYYRNLLESIELEIRYMEKCIDEVKLELMEAIKERKIMEKIKEKEFKAFLDAINVMEAKATDEVVNFQNSKRSGD